MVTDVMLRHAYQQDQESFNAAITRFLDLPMMILNAAPSPTHHFALAGVVPRGLTGGILTARPGGAVGRRDAAE
ncbi:hypothetical protein [Rhodopila sp.]|uniref:hypothetical protein n=1 Tax=Rhodopila sp. TaxID=2480087 RepID=UPI003D14FDA0